VTVTLFGQTNPRPARVIGTDPTQDLALVQIENVKGLPTVQLGDSNLALVGDNVLAIGNALALAGGLTVTEGIVSSKNRSLTATSDITGRSETLSGLIQTDAAINSGNSGGPLVNASGQVIGMNTAVAESTQGNAPAQDIGFAIAIDTIKPLLAQLRSGGTGGT
jgi:S1-C subfamily serine protease